MAAPTNVSVESTSLSSATLYWSYSGANAIGIYRALHGEAYTELTDSSTRVVPGTTTFVDLTAVAGTFYDYKLSDDLGSIFSSVVSVVIQTCVPTTGSTQSTLGPGLPQFIDQTDVNPQSLQQLSQQLEATINTQANATNVCTPCSANGALVLDCSTGCTNFQVVVTEDINSISIVGCDQSSGHIDFVVPPGATRKICGFPAGFGFSGNECLQALVRGGTNGRTIGADFNGKAGKPASSFPGYGAAGGLGRGGGSAGSACQCLVSGFTNSVTLMCCNTSHNCSLGCSGTKKLPLMACGGIPPYTWTHTGSITLDKTTGSNVIVSPPTNTGSGVAGNAYQISGYNCNACFTGSGNCGAAAVDKKVIYGCNDQVITCGDSSTTDVCSPSVPSAGSMTCHDGACGAGQPVCSVPVCPDAGMGDLVQATCDARTAGMISAGCKPCGLNIGATVTVTDSVGKSATKIMRF